MRRRPTAPFMFCAGLIIAGMPVFGGDLDPAAAPGPSMRTLEELGQQLDALEEQSRAADESLRELILEMASALGLRVNAYQVTTVATAGSSSLQISLAYGPHGHPAIAFRGPGDHPLRFARHDGSQWVVTTADARSGSGLFCSLDFGPDQLPAIAHALFGSPTTLWYNRFNGTDWEQTQVSDIEGYGNFWGHSLKFSPKGHLAIAYPSADGSSILFAELIDGTWNIETAIDRLPVGAVPRLTFLPDGEPGIVYLQVSGTGSLRHTKREGSQWITTEVERSAISSIRPSIAVDPLGHPAVVFARSGGELCLARFDGQAWSTTPVVTGALESVTALDFGPGGFPAISHRMMEGPAISRFDGFFWNTLIVETTPIGRTNDLAFSPQGVPTVAYCPINGGDLRFAELKTIAPP